LKQAQELEKNYLQVAKKRRGYIYKGGNNPQRWSNWYDEDLDYQIKTIHTTQDTPKMIADFISKITKIVDYDRVYLFPCVNTTIPSGISNMIRNDKKNNYNFNKGDKSSPRNQRFNAGQGAVIIIPAGYSLPPLKLKHFYLLGDDGRQFWKDKVKAKEQRGYYYGNSVDIPRYIPIS